MGNNREKASSPASARAPRREAGWDRGEQRVGPHTRQADASGSQVREIHCSHGASNPAGFHWPFSFGVFTRDSVMKYHLSVPEEGAAAATPKVDSSPRVQSQGANLFSCVSHLQNLAVSVAFEKKGLFDLVLMFCCFCFYARKHLSAKSTFLGHMNQ